MITCYHFFLETSHTAVSVAESHHFYVAPAPGENFDAATAPAPTLLNSKPKIFKEIKVNIRSDILFSSDTVL
jgi:hypothetical protein